MVLLISNLAAAADCGPVQAVEAFVKAADTRDADALERLLHPAFRAVVHVQGKEGVDVLDRETWLSLLRAGKIGGTERQASVEAVVQGDGIATVKGRLVAPTMRFDSTWTVTSGPTCQLVQDATVLELLP
ncbi:MAG: nuclear transport factor 2 family protein [Alphaproteobacteria bacterium]|nr:nuclear transport factor 2 family protein [Alphaproteobacteria bacterium]